MPMLKYSKSGSSKDLLPPSNRHHRARGSIGGHGSTRQRQSGGARPTEARNRQWRRVVFPGAPTRNGPEGRVQQRRLEDRRAEGTRSDRWKEPRKEHRSQRLHRTNSNSASPTRRLDRGLL